MALVNKSFEDLFEFSRASEATYWDSNGVLQIAGVDEPRFYHDPVTGEPEGILLEREATNHIASNTEFFISYANFTGNQESDPFLGPVMRMAAVADGEDSTGFNLSLGTSYPAGNPSYGPTLRVIYAKYVNCKYVSLRTAGGPTGITVDITTGEIVQSRGLAAEGSFVRLMANGWCEIAWRNDTEELSGVGNMYLVLFGSEAKNVINGQGIAYVEGDEVLLAYPSWYSNGEALSPPSIIPTSGSPVTRAEDLINIPISGV